MKTAKIARRDARTAMVVDVEAVDDVQAVTAAAVAAAVPPATGVDSRGTSSFDSRGTSSLEITSPITSLSATCGTWTNKT